jgi:hypothetical protein
MSLARQLAGRSADPGFLGQDVVEIDAGDLAGTPVGSNCSI